MSRKKLTTKQERFCDEYVVDWNATRSAIAAGYSKKTAYSQGQRLLKDVEIQERIELVKNDLERLSGVSALRSINKLRNIAFTNMGRFKDDWMTEREYKSLTDADLDAISEIQHQTKEFDTFSEKVVKFKLHCPMKAMDQLSKMLGHNKADKLDLSNSDGSLSMTPEERQKRIEAIKSKIK